MTITIDKMVGFNHHNIPKSCDTGAEIQLQNENSHRTVGSFTRNN